MGNNTFEGLNFVTPIQYVKDVANLIWPTVSGFFGKNTSFDTDTV